MAELIEIVKEKESETAVICGVDTGEFDIERAMNELEALCETAGAKVIAHFVQKTNTIQAATFIGQGKLQEISDFCEKNEVDTVIFNHELTASQMRNIEEATKTVVIDRTALILDIFAQRANSAEGRLQVELAQLKYRLPRLSGLGGVLSRQGGGIGSRGPGEAKLETDKRYIRHRIEKLEKQLRELQKRRNNFHKRRKKEGITTVAIVGYTNVGKSTLLNALTDAGVLAENKLFATLDPTARALKLPDGREVMLVDTVGLVSRLPHNLVEAFKSTLEEAVNAELILNVCDVSSDEAREQIKITRNLLDELGGGDIPVITVANKYDKVLDKGKVMEDRTVFISAKTGYGLEDLLEKISEALKKGVKDIKLLVPYKEAGVLNVVRENGKILSEEYKEDGIAVEGIIDKISWEKIKEYVVE